MIVLVGASASGKTEVAKLLAIKYGLKKVITHTTRLKRSGETNGVDYHFVSEDEFLFLKSQHAFIETTFYNHHYYGTSYQEVSDDKVLIVDANGLKSFQAIKQPKIVTFLMVANENTRLNRMLYRGDPLDNAKKRIANDRLDFDQKKIGHIDYVINTEDISIEQVCDKVFQLYQQNLSNK